MFQLSKSLLVFIVLLIYNALNVEAQGDIQRKQLFDYDWRFFLGDDPAAANSSFDDKDWRQLDLPHDWSIEGKIDKNNPAGGDGGFFPTGIGWYRKTFTVPAAWKGKRISVYF